VRHSLLVVLAVGSIVALAACSNSSSGSGTVNNVQPIVSNSGPGNDYFDGAFTSVTICAPGSSTNCQTIDGVLVDTGSSGLRLLSSVVTVGLPQQTDGSGNPIEECLPFLDGYTWGPVQTADITLAGEKAPSTPIQIIGGAAAPAVPAACVSGAVVPVSEDTLDDLGANGILGVGLFLQDCGSACTFVGASNPGVYFSCPVSGCVTYAEPLSSQLQNPVSRFAQDNNGTLITLPSVSDTGVASISGTMIFGIGTQGNNSLGSAKVLTVDANGLVTTVFNGQGYANSFIDSGSNGYYFLDTSATGLPLCPDTSDFYCPPTPVSLSATIIGANQVSTPISFVVVDADPLLNNPAVSVFNGIAGPTEATFDWGLPFFFGRPVFTAIEGQTTPGGVGPYYAY
jgi:hypothetical protein